MGARKILEQKREQIIEKWKAATLNVDGAPGKFASMLMKNGDPFTNPMGFTVQNTLNDLFDALLDGREDVDPILDEIVRVKAVQETEPSESMSFLFLGKTVIREALEDSLDHKKTIRELQKLEDLIDLYSLKAFNIFMACKKQIFDIKIDEIKRNNFADFDTSLSCSSKSVVS